MRGVLVLLVAFTKRFKLPVIGLVRLLTVVTLKLITSGEVAEASAVPSPLTLM